MPDSPLLRLRRAVHLDRACPDDAYVAPTESASREVARLLALDIDSNPKVLLIGPRGGGKSSELQAIRRELRSRFWVLGFDVDASGLSAANVSAFDILYLTSLCFLRCLRQLAPQEDAEALYRDLAQAYFESERSVGGPDALLPAPTENPEPRPSLDEALSGLADFADTAMAVAPQALPMIAPIGVRWEVHPLLLDALAESPS
jgi:hypothetical protein